jgi:hypothetical protein
MELASTLPKLLEIPTSLPNHRRFEYGVVDSPASSAVENCSHTC